MAKPVRGSPEAEVSCGKSTYRSSRILRAPFLPSYIKAAESLIRHQAQDNQRRLSLAQESTAWRNTQLQWCP